MSVSRAYRRAQRDQAAVVNRPFIVPVLNQDPGLREPCNLWILADGRLRSRLPVVSGGAVTGYTVMECRGEVNTESVSRAPIDTPLSPLSRLVTASTVGGAQWRYDLASSVTNTTVSENVDYTTSDGWHCVLPSGSLNYQTQAVRWADTWTRVSGAPQVQYTPSLVSTRQGQVGVLCSRAGMPDTPSTYFYDYNVVTQSGNAKVGMRTMGALPSLPSGAPSVQRVWARFTTAYPTGSRLYAFGASSLPATLGATGVATDALRKIIVPLQVGGVMTEVPVPSGIAPGVRFPIPRDV